MSSTTDDELLALAGKATPGPWAVVIMGRPGDDHYLVAVDQPGRVDPVAVAEQGRENSEDNAAYIAAANPPAIRALITRLRVAEERVKGVAGVVDHLTTCAADDERRSEETDRDTESRIYSEGRRAGTEYAVEKLRAALAFTNP